MYFLTEVRFFHFFSGFHREKRKMADESSLLPPGSNIVKDWQEVARYVFLLSHFSLSSFSFYPYFYSSFSHGNAIVTRKARFDYFTGVIRRIGMRMFLFFLRFGLNSRYTWFFSFFPFSSNFVSSFRLKRTSSSFSSVAFYVALFLFHPCENFAINFRRFCTDSEFRWINKFEIDRSGFVLSKFFVR